MVGTAFFDDKYKNMSNNSLPPHPAECNFTQYTVHILYVDQLETIALTTEMEKKERIKEKHKTWLHSRMVL